VPPRPGRAAIRRRGFVPGAPVCVVPFCRLADMKVCRGMKRQCERPGLDCQPYKDGGNGYRVVAACLDCGFGKEI
jgi:hypothetical protein